MKLLAKTAEERYQTAAGVESGICGAAWSQWEAEGRIDGFTPGAHDTADCLMIPREAAAAARAIDTLLTAFDRVVAGGAAGAGAGLRILRHRQVGGRERAPQAARASARPVCLRKFDQSKRDIPDATERQPSCAVPQGESHIAFTRVTCIS